MKHIKTFENYNNINENNENVDNTYIKTIEFNGEKLALHKYSDNPMSVLFYLDTMDGESYMDINTTIKTNMLIDAIWVKNGGDEEIIADGLDFLEKTDRTTKSGFNKYIMYNIIG